MVEAAPSETQARGHWSAPAPLAVPRSGGHALVRLRDGRVLCIGGVHAGSCLRDIELFDPSRGSWSRVAPMAHARAFCAAVLLDDGRVLVVGGFRPDPTRLAAPETYDVRADAWRPAGPATAVGGFPVHGVAVEDGTAYFASVDQRLHRGTLEHFNGERLVEPVTFEATGGVQWIAAVPGWVRWVHGVTVAQWRGSQLTEAGLARHPHTYGAWVRLPGGGCFAAAGEDLQGTPTPSAETGLPGDGQAFQRLPPLDAPRTHVAAAALADGSVVVTGGTDRRLVYPTVRLWDAGLRQWYAARSMTVPRHEASAVTLGPQRVLVVGGRIEAAARTAEVFEDDGNRSAGPCLPPAQKRKRAAAQPDARARAVLLGLQNAWAALNTRMFQGRLRPVTMELADLERTVASWNPADRLMRFSRQACTTLLWPQVEEVLKHEMAHQFVSDVLGVTDEASHGRAFRETCARLGIDARATGTPELNLAPEEQAVLRKVEKLRALATSPNAHESATAQALADRLVNEFKELFDAMSPPAADETVSVRHVGVMKLRRDAVDTELAHVVAEHGGVRIIWTNGLDDEGHPAGSILELLGPPSNLERAAYLHDFLARAIGELWEADRRRHGGASRTARTSFMVAALREFARKLAKEPVHAHALIPATLARVDQFTRARYPRLRTTYSRSSVDPHAAARGASAGRDLEFRQGVDGAAGPRLLGPRK
ncbi:MAG: DUF2786 domain-containing protein [Deltaproteobacteria bacterium]|nr:DUF2786 domain-containing protein [Deltaproteobacteria bacterium]